MTHPHPRLLDWCKAQVTSLAGYPDDGQISTYLLTLPSKQQLLDYCNGLFGSSNNVTLFVNELWSRKQREGGQNSGGAPALRREDSEEDERRGGENKYGVIDNDQPNRPKEAEPSKPPASHSTDSSQASSSSLYL
jgi:hypothetical protein